MKKGLFVFLLIFCCSLLAMVKVYNSGDLSPCDDKMCEQSENLANGILKEYHENGNLAFEAPWKNGMPEGIEKVYYENGNLEFEALWKNNKIEGISKWYYENGNLKFEIPWKNNKIEGIVKRYDINGNLRCEIVFKEGKAISGFMYDFITGKKQEMTNADLHNLLRELYVLRELSFILKSNK